MDIPYRTLTELAAARIQELILSGELKAGTKIDQAALAAEFDMSRMPIREALRELAARGLVKAIPHRGMVVAQLTPDEIEETYEIRAALEGLASRLASPNLSSADLAAMVDCLDRMEPVRDVDEWIRLNAEFHGIIERQCGRPRLLELIRRLRNQCETYVRVYPRYLERDAFARQEHRAILKACQDRSEEDVERTMRSHLLNTGRSLAAWLHEQQTGETSVKLAAS